MIRFETLTSLWNSNVARGKGATMKRMGLLVLLTVFLVTGLMATYHDERAVSAMEYVVDPGSGLFHQTEGLQWIDTDPANRTQPLTDNRNPSYLGATLFMNAALWAGMNASGVGVPYAFNGIERIFITNNVKDTSAALHIATTGGIEPWFSEASAMGAWQIHKMLMGDAQIPWRFDPTMTFATDSTMVYLERVLWGTYFLTISDNYEYSPYIVKILRGIRDNDLYYNNVNGAIKYNGVDNLYLTALWGLVLESHMRSFHSYPVRFRPTAPPEPPATDYDWDEEAEGAWLYVSTMLNYYRQYILPVWFSHYSSPSDVRSPMAVADGLRRWESLPIMMFAAINGNSAIAESLWLADMEDASAMTWRNDINDYFRFGPIWNGTRSYYEPMTRFGAIYCYYDLGQMEMFRATSDSQYINRILTVENTWFNPFWTGNNWAHATNAFSFINGLYSWVSCHIPELEIVSVTSDLPHPGIPPFDYDANTTQSHHITIKIANHSLVAVDSIRLRVRGDYIGPGGNHTGYVYAVHIEPGETLDVIYDIGAPGIACDHMIAVLVWDEPWSSLTTNTQNQIRVNVTAPPQIRVAYTGGSPESAPSNPFITEGSAFDIEVRFTNTGGGNLGWVDLDLTQSSPYGLEFTFPFGSGYAGPVDVPGGGNGSVFIPAIAPMGTGIIGNDIYVEMMLNSIIDANTGLPLGSVIGASLTIIDDDEWFNIQHAPLLTPINVTASGWLNATDPCTVRVWLSNAAGDYATADSFDFYDHRIQLEASVITGVLGLDAAVDGTPAIPAGTTGGLEFVLWNDGVSENVWADVHAIFPYHDANRGDEAEPVDSPFDHVFPNALGIDVLAPSVNPLAPMMGTLWPVDNTVKIQGFDNLSGVAGIWVYFMDAVGGNYWDAIGGWGATADTFALAPFSGSEWRVTIGTPPTGANYIMYVLARDVAGNWMPVKYVAVGNIGYVNIIENGADLWRGGPFAPVPPGAVWDYECDANWTYVCSVLVFNHNAYTVQNVELRLRSTSPHTFTDTLGNGTLNIPPLSGRWFWFTVTEPGYSFIDSLYFDIVSGVDNLGRPIGEQYTDKDLIVKVERPVDFEIVEVWLDPDSVTQWNGADGLVSHYQTFTYHATIRNNGDDVIDSVVVWPDQAGIVTNNLISPVGPFTFYNKGNGWTETLTFSVIADTNNPGPNPEQWDTDLLLLSNVGLGGFTANNHPPGYSTGLSTITDDFAPIGVQQNSDLQTDYFWSNGDANLVWINRTNTVTVTAALYNRFGTAGGAPQDDRSAADRINDPGYGTEMVLYEPFSWTLVPSVAGGETPVEVTSAVVEPGDTTWISWDLSWDGTPPSYEGDVRMYDWVEFGDQNWQSRRVSRWSPASTISTTGILAVDFTKPVVTIVAPNAGGMYNEFPETLKVLVTDNVSGVVHDSVKVQFENPAGDIWDGTVWGPNDVWFTAHFDLTIGADTFWYDIPEQTMEGCYTYRAYAYDVAGNKSDVKEVNFIYDITPPNNHFVLPYAGYYSYTGCDVWDQVIQVWAYDDTTNATTACVSHVKNVYVAIKDTIRGQWWNGATWQTSASVPWLACTPTADPLIWQYSGYTDMTGAVLEFFCYSRDYAGNPSSDHDTLQYVNIDENVPNSVITNNVFNELPGVSVFNFDTWAANMNNYLWGFAYDPWSRIDQIDWALYDDLTGRHWDGTSWVASGTDIWLSPTHYSYNGAVWFAGAPNPGTLFTFGADTLYWRAAWSPPGYGHYRIRTRSYDDLCHEEAPLFDSQNEKWFYYDNCGPVIYPRFPEAGRAYYILEWHDSLAVFAYDSCGFPMDDVDSVKFWLTNSTGEYWGWHPVWMMMGWWPMPISVSGNLLPGGDHIWMYRYPGMITTPGSYNLFVRAYDSAGNIALNAWNFIITVSGQYLTIENFQTVPNDDPYFVDELWNVRVTAWHHPGVVDTNFAHQLVFGNTMPTPADFELLAPGPYYTYRGVLEVPCVAHAPILGLEVFVDSPTSGLPRASTEPIDIIGLVDDAIAGFVIDNPGDQGDLLWIHHNRTPQDPGWGDPGTIDTLSIKILEYRYYRDMNLSPAPGDTTWQPVLPILATNNDGDSVRVQFGNFNTFTEYAYSMIVKVQIQGLADSMFTGRIMLGSQAPIDNIEPASIVDLAATAVPGGIQLDWTAVTLGWEGTPEINPAVNIVYDIYRFTDPYGPIGAPLVAGWPNNNYVDAAGAGDVTTPYYYVVKARDFSNNESPNESNRVGEVDYLIADGWSSFGYPLGVAGLVTPAAYTARFGVPYNNIYTYVNPPGGWYGLRVFGIDFDVLIPETQAMLGNITGFGTNVMTWTGDVPDDSTAIVYNLSYDTPSGNGWNLVMLPLHHGAPEPAVMMASDLYYELVGLGLDPLTVAYRVSGGGWVSIVDLGGTIYFDFEIHPGQVYLLWVNNDGVWPAYARSGGAPEPVNAGFEPSEVGIEMPKSSIIPVYTADGGIVEALEVTAIWGDQSIICSYQNGIARVEFSDFDGIIPGVEIQVVFEGEGYLGQTTIAAPNGPVDVAKEVYLERSTPTLPEEFVLYANVPNPFNPTTAIKFDLPEAVRCDLSVYNLNGRKVRTLISEDIQAGYHRAVWDGRDDTGKELPGGIYFYKLSAGDFSAQRRMLFVK